MAIARRIIPMPPIQCVMLLQRRIPWGSFSTDAKIVAPVVVKPDMASKYASTKCRREPERIYGSDPNKPAATHSATVIAKPSLWETSIPRSLNRRETPAPVPEVNMDEKNRALAADDSPYARDIDAGTSMEMPKKRHNIPRI